MNIGWMLFSQIMDFVPWTSFVRLMAKYGGDVRVRTLPCTEQFRDMAFARITYRESLRDLEACLGAQPLKLYGMGFRKAVAKSTPADANERRDWRLWHGLAGPDKHPEAIASRPLLLAGIAERTRHSRHTTLRIASAHGRARGAELALTGVVRFPRGLAKAAEQFTDAER